MSGHARWIDRQRALGGGVRGRRVLVGERPPQPEVSRRPLAIDPDRIVVRPDGIRIVVLFEEQVAPRGVNRRIARRHAGGAAEVAVGLAKLVERPSGPPGPVQSDRLAQRAASLDHRHELISRLRLPSEVHVEQAQLERRVTPWVGRGDGSQQLLGFLIAASRDQDSRAYGGGRGIVRGPRRRECLGFLDRAVRKGPRGRLMKRQLLDRRDRPALAEGRRGRGECRKQGGEQADADRDAADHPLPRPRLGASRSRGCRMHKARADYSPRLSH